MELIGRSCLTEREPGRQPIDESINRDGGQNETRPCISFQKVLDYKVPKVPKPFQIDFLDK